MGAAPDREAFARAAEAALADARPSGDNAFKIELAKRVVDARPPARGGRNARAHAGAARVRLQPETGVPAHA